MGFVSSVESLIRKQSYAVTQGVDRPPARPAVRGRAESRLLCRNPARCWPPCLGSALA